MNVAFQSKGAPEHYNGLATCMQSSMHIVVIQIRDMDFAADVRILKKDVLHHVEILRKSAIVFQG